MSLPREIKMQGEINTKRHEALLNIVLTGNVIWTLSGAFFSPLGLTEAQYNILIVLKLEKRRLTQVEIGERLISSRANITLILDKMEAKGFVKRERIENDRRVLMVDLTAKGRKLVDAVENQYVAEVERLMACLTESECKEMSRLLVKLRTVLREGEGK